jgi:LuxR family maltose regulon positive regulatory protein
VVAALVAGGVVRDRSPLRDRDRWARFADADVDELWVHLADLPAPVALVIDDFQVITSDRVLAQVGRLIAKLPPTPLRLVLLSRSDPVLPLHHLRTRGDLTDIRAADLAFTPPEAAALFTGRGLQLRTAQVGQIITRTAGWPAGVQAATLLIEGPDVQTGVDRFCAPGRADADYLVTAILQALTPADRDFLLSTSGADMVNSELADQLSGRSDSRLILEKLFDRGLFTVKRGPDGWYSYQPMVRYLLSHLPDAAGRPR